MVFPLDLLTVESKNDIPYDNVDPHLSCPTDNPSKETLFNECNDMNSFLPLGEGIRRNKKESRSPLLNKHSILLFKMLMQQLIHTSVPKR